MNLNRNCNDALFVISIYWHFTTFSSDKETEEFQSTSKSVLQNIWRYHAIIKWAQKVHSKKLSTIILIRSSDNHWDINARKRRQQSIELSKFNFKFPIKLAHWEHSSWENMNEKSKTKKSNTHPSKFEKFEMFWITSKINLKFLHKIGT